MADADFTKNPYEVLGISPGGPEVTEAEIKKAYKAKALKLHPDKRAVSEREVAEKEFNELKRYYELLCDASARKAFDELVLVRRARAEKDSALDDRRKRMKQDLEEREKAFDSRRSDEAMAKARLKAEIDRLRRTAAEKDRAAAAERRAAADPLSSSASGSNLAADWRGPNGQGGAGPSGAGAGQHAAAQEQLRRTLKLAWDRRDGDYGATRLREIFGAFGPIEDLVLRESAKSAKGSALVVMATGEGARRAANSQSGDLSNPILVIPASKSGLPDAPHLRPSSSDPAGLDAMATAANNGAPKAPAPPTQPQAAAEQPAAAAAFAAGAGGAGVRPSASAPFLGGFSAPLFPGGGAAAAGGGAFQAMGAAGAVGRDYENVTLYRMRQAAERAKLVAEMEREEAEGGRGAAN